MKLGLFKSTEKPTMLIVTIFIAALLTDSLTVAQINVEPNTAVLNEGDKTDLLCRYGRPLTYCRIEIPGEKVLNLSPDWNKTPSFTYYGAGLNVGQCGVTIEHVKAINNGQVKCSLGVEGEEFSGAINLVVALRPQQPLITLVSKPDRDGTFVEGTNFQARCIVRDGRPAANISWYIDDMPANKRTGQLEVRASAMGNIELSTTEQEIQWQLGPEDNGRKLICRSHHQTDRENVPPQEGGYLVLVRFPPVRQTELNVYGLYLEHTAVVNVTIRANPAPNVEWTVDGLVIPQGTQNGRYAVFEPQYLGKDYYNVTMTIAGLTLEDTTKTYQLTASNALGRTDYQVRISSSSAPPAAGLDIAAIVGIVVAVAVLIVIVLLVLFARATGRWCFGGKSIKTPTNETSDTESADVKATSTATTATTAAASEGVTGTNETCKKSKRLPTFTAIFKRFNEKDSSKQKKDNAQPSADTVETPAADDAESNEPENGIDGNDNEPKEDKQLVYAELVLKPSDKNETQQQQQIQQQNTQQKSSTEYAEIVYVQKQQQEQDKK